MKKHGVYRHYDADNCLLYVGCSANPFGRFAYHKSQSKWAYDVARVTIEWFSTKSEAMAAERAAIESESPQHNVAGRRPIRKNVRPPATNLLGRLGHVPVAKAVGVPLSHVQTAANLGKIPAEWYGALCDMAGQDLPREAFYFKRASA